MFRLPCLALAVSIVFVPIALAEPPEAATPAVQKAVTLAPETLEKIREITGLAPGEKLDLASLTPEQREQVMALLAGGGDDGAPRVRVAGEATPEADPARDDGASAPPRVGDPAPPLSIDRYYGDPDLPDASALSWDDLAGRVTVLEFSATWCAPCIAAIPHMNELVEAFADESVVFLTVSNETESQAEKLATEHGLKGVLAWDADGSTFEAFWVNGIPRVAIIDREGRIAALTHPMLVTPEAIRAVLAGETIDLQNTHPDPQRMSWNHNGVGQDQDSTTPRTIVERTDIVSGQMHRSPKTGMIRAGGASLQVAFSTAFGGMADDLVFETELPEDEYIRIDIVPADGKLETSRALLLERLCGMYGVVAEPATKRMPLLALRRIPGADAPPPGAGEGGLRYMGTTLELGNGTMADLTTGLRYAVRTPVVDETGLDGKYAIALQWEFGAGAEGVGAALEQYGLELVEIEGEHDVLVIRDAE
jgi:thiol-disulfide isomerase/thioredoxin